MILTFSELFWLFCLAALAAIILCIRALLALIAHEMMHRMMMPSSALLCFPGSRLLVTSSTRTPNSTAPSKWVVGTVLLGGTATAAGYVWAKEQSKVKDIQSQIASLIEKDNKLGPTFLRLAWHASGTFCKADSSGGSNGGTIRFQPELGYGANAGLDSAIAKLEEIKANNPDLTYADLFVLSGVTAVEEMGGPSVPFQFGRSDAKDGQACTDDGRLPDADKGCPGKTAQHIRDIFYRMGFNDQEIVALVGAHAVGRCYPSRSGYSGPWTRAEWTFSNEYFRELLENKWTLKQWKGPEQYEDPTGDLMMLPADMVMIQDPSFRKYVELYAKDEDLWHRDFSSAFQRLTENGATFSNGGWRRYLPF